MFDRPPAKERVAAYRGQGVTAKDVLANELPYIADALTSIGFAASMMGQESFERQQLVANANEERYIPGFRDELVREGAKGEYMLPMTNISAALKVFRDIANDKTLNRNLRA